MSALQIREIEEKKMAQVSVIVILAEPVFMHGSIEKKGRRTR